MSYKKETYEEFNENFYYYDQGSAYYGYKSSSISEEEINEKLNEIFEYSDQGSAYHGYKVISINEENKIEYINMHSGKVGHIDANKSSMIKNFLDTINNSDLYYKRDYCATHLNKAIHDELHDIIIRNKPANKKPKSNKKNKYAP